MNLEEKVLQKLKEQKNVSGEMLAREFNVSRMAVCKAVGRLRAEGYRIESKPRKGYRLLPLEDEPLNIFEIGRNLGTKVVGREIYCLKEVDSTMDEVKKFAEKPEGLVVVAERQLKGRGRLSREWFSPKGGLYLSILLKPKIQPQMVPCLSLLGGLAVCETVRSLYQMDAKLKWPNDVVYGGRKLSGVLVEASIEQDLIHYVILGIGVNLNLDKPDFPPSLRKTACSVKMVLQRQVSRPEFARNLLRKIDYWYDVLHKKGSEPIIEAWVKLSSTIGKLVKVRLPGGSLTGIAETLDEDGALILKTPNGNRVKVYAGEVQV